MCAQRLTTDCRMILVLERSLSENSWPFVVHLIITFFTWFFVHRKHKEAPAQDKDQPYFVYMANVNVCYYEFISSYNRSCVTLDAASIPPSPVGLLFIIFLISASLRDPNNVLPSLHFEGSDATCPIFLSRRDPRNVLLAPRDVDVMPYHGKVWVISAKKGLVLGMASAC